MVYWYQWRNYYMAPNDQIKKHQNVKIKTFFSTHTVNYRVYHNILSTIQSRVTLYLLNYYIQRSRGHSGISEYLTTASPTTDKTIISLLYNPRHD